MKVYVYAWKYIYMQPNSTYIHSIYHHGLSFTYTCLLTCVERFETVQMCDVMALENGVGFVLETMGKIG